MQDMGTNGLRAYVHRAAAMFDARTCLGFVLSASISPFPIPLFSLIPCARVSHCIMESIMRADMLRGEVEEIEIGLCRWQPSTRILHPYYTRQSHTYTSHPHPHRVAGSCVSEAATVDSNQPTTDNSRALHLRRHALPTRRPHYTRPYRIAPLPPSIPMRARAVGSLARVSMKK